ncbi:MAG: hypothetical protein NTV04_03310, partial [Deltaproteobacteria bacterium]|nr:hypothetical protein [Deltaproteobacteria bacterium]
AVIPAEARNQFFQVVKNSGSSPIYSERQKKVVMVKEPALSRKSPHPPFVKGGQGGISGYPFARFRKSVAVMSTYLGRSL